jgi:hypothetical protein
MFRRSSKKKGAVPGSPDDPDDPRRSDESMLIEEASLEYVNFKLLFLCSKVEWVRILIKNVFF